MAEYVIIACCILFVVASIVVLGTYTDRFSPYRCRRDIARAKEKYTVPIVEKCILVEEREVIRNSGDYYTSNPSAHVDEFFYANRENMMRKFLILRYTALLLMAVAAIVFLVLSSNLA